MTEFRIKDLLSKMTNDQKIGQLHEYFSYDDSFDPQIVHQGKGK